MLEKERSRLRHVSVLSHRPRQRGTVHLRPVLDLSRACSRGVGEGSVPQATAAVAHVGLAVNPMSPYEANKLSSTVEETGPMIMTMRRSIAHRHVLDTLAERENIFWKSLRAQLVCRPPLRKLDAPSDRRSRSNEEPGWTCRNLLCSDGCFDQSRWVKSGIPTSPRLARFTLLQRGVYTHRRRSNYGVSGPHFYRADVPKMRSRLEH